MGGSARSRRTRSPSPRRTHEPAGVPVTGPADGSPDADAIRADIEATREQLGRTVDELAHRLDVPTRAKERALRTRDTAVETYRENPPVVLGALAALVAVAVGIVVWRTKR
jgi:hypothetical protein